MSLATELYNVVVLPVTAAAARVPLFQLSAGRRDGARRLVSAFLTEAELREAMRLNGTPDGQVDQLLLGNRMAYAPRDTRRLFFSEEQLLAMGLTEPLATLPSEEFASV